MLTNPNIPTEWLEELRKKPDGERFVALQTAQELKHKGYTVREAQNMLDVKRFASNVVDSVLEEVYENVLNTQTQDSITVMACPSSYREVAGFVNEALSNHTSKEFIDLLACSQDPILKVSNKSLASWYRLANQAKQDSYARGILHNDLKPWIEEAMCASVLTSRSKDFGNVKLASRESNQCVFVEKNQEVKVDLEKGTCSCDKFSKSNFAIFGLACEHMIKFSETVSPFNRIKRAINL